MAGALRRFWGPKLFKEKKGWGFADAPEEEGEEYSYSYEEQEDGEEEEEEYSYSYDSEEGEEGEEESLEWEHHELKNWDPVRLVPPSDTPGEVRPFGYEAVVEISILVHTIIYTLDCLPYEFVERTKIIMSETT